MNGFNIFRLRWHVVQTKPCQELQAVEHLTSQDYPCFLPMFRREKCVHGRIQVLAVPLFSRYLFIQLDIAGSDLALPLNTRGVCKLVAFGGQLPTVSESCVETLRNLSDRIHGPAFENNEKFLITGRAPGRWERVFEIPDGEVRAMTLIQYLSQPQPLETEIKLVRRAA